MGTKESIDDAEKIEKEILMSLEGKIIPFEKIQNMDEKDIIFYILDLTKTAENSKKNNRNSFISIHSVVAAAIFADSHPLHDICPVNACHFMGKIKRYVRANFWLLLFTFYGLVFFVVGLFEWITSWGTP